MLKEGDAAPDFVLKDADGRDVRLSALQGKGVVLYFYPRDHTAGCTLEARNFREQHEGFEARGIRIVGVSLDMPATHCEFRDKHGLPFTLLSDPEGRVHDLYDAWLTTLLGRSSVAVRRCTYVIDRDGIIRKVYPRVIPLRHAQQVLKDMDELGISKPLPAAAPAAPPPKRG